MCSVPVQERDTRRNTVKLEKKVFKRQRRCFELYLPIYSKASFLSAHNHILSEVIKRTAHVEIHAKVNVVEKITLEGHSVDVSQ